MGLLLGSDNAEQDRRNFFKTQLIFWVFAATDGHGKNFNITHLARGHYWSYGICFWHMPELFLSWRIVIVHLGIK